MTISDTRLQALALETGHRLKSARLRLATAESCTGGWIAKCMTDVAGSSEWFDRGFVTYSNQAKMEMLGVRAATLARHGAVSEQTVREMAAGALANSRARVAVAVSGIAGPSGGTPEKPVGTVWLGWQLDDNPALARRWAFEGDRDAIRRQAVLKAMEGLLDVCSRQ